MTPEKDHVKKKMREHSRRKRELLAKQEAAKRDPATDQSAITDLDPITDKSGHETAPRSLDSLSRARLSTLADRTAEEIVNHILAGKLPVDAAVMSGVSTATWYRWLEEGKSDPDGRYGSLAKRV